VRILTILLGVMLFVLVGGESLSEKFTPCEYRIWLLQSQSELTSEGVASISHQQKPRELTSLPKSELERRAYQVAKAYALAGIIEKGKSEISLQTVVSNGNGETKIKLRSTGQIIDLRFCQKIEGDKMYVLAIGEISREPK
jgi:hypothetical protein